jgi:thiol-disulfide isomerase/thioredoxin
MRYLRNRMINMSTTKMNFFKIVLLSILLCACTKPDYELTSGEKGSFVDWKGKWVFINYWATWCAPCHEEIPELNTFSKAHNDVMVLGVNFDRPQGEAIQKDIAQMGIEFPVLTQDPAVALNFSTPSVLPATIVLNPQGKLHATLFGPQTQSTLMKVMKVK